MTARNDDRLLSAWLHDIAPAREPEHLLGEVLARTARTRRRAAWRSPERWNPMSAITTRLAPAAPVPWRLIAVAAALLVALVIGLALVASGAFRQPAPPFGPAGNGQLFYSRDGDLYARGTDGRAVAILTGTDVDGSPVLSPDGTKLSFIRSTPFEPTQIWAMDVGGGNLVQLGIPEGEPGWFEWSPQADAAAYLSDGNGLTRNLYMVPADGSPAVAHDLGVVLEQAYFLAPSGSRLGLRAVDPSGTRGLYLVNRDGTGLVRLELDPGYETDPDYAAQKGFYFWEASWSPSGDRVLYTQREPGSASRAWGLRTRLATFDASGAVISDTLLVMDPASDGEFGAQWLPTGDGFVFQRTLGSRQWLSYAPLAGSGAGPARDLGIEASDWINAQVSPDGTTILATVPVAGREPVLYLVDLASGDRTEVEIGEDASWQRLGR